MCDGQDLGKPSREKISFCLEKVQMALTPPPILGILWGIFLKPYFRQTKVPQNVWILVIEVKRYLQFKAPFIKLLQ